MKAKLGSKKVRPWKWMPFTNPARKDGAMFYHWRRVAEEGKDYPFARFNKVSPHHLGIGQGFPHTVMSPLHGLQRQAQAFVSSMVTHSVLVANTCRAGLWAFSAMGSCPSPDLLWFLVAALVPLNVAVL